MIVISIIVFLLLVRGAFYILDSSLNVPSSAAQKGVRETIKKKTLTDRMEEVFIVPCIKLIAPFVKISDEREKKLKYMLGRADIKESPKEYYAKAIVYLGFSLLIPLMLYILGIPNMVTVGFILAGVIFYRQLTSYKAELKKKNKAIEKGLPSFIRSILYQLNDTKTGVVKADLIGIFENYLSVANPVFAWDISVLIMEMKSKDLEVALRSFASRLAIPQVGFLCNALLGLTRGEAQHETLAALAREMDIKGKDNIKKENEAKPKKVYIACIPLFSIAIIAMGYVLLMEFTRGIASFA